MTSQEFLNTFYGPVNRHNREKLLAREGIGGFAGLPIKRLGWTGFINALGDRHGLDVRNFGCEAAFVDALAERVTL